VSRTRHDILLGLALTGILSLTTGAMLVAHLTTESHEKHACAPCEGKPVDHEDHDSEKCDICKFLLSPASKYIAYSPTQALVPEEILINEPRVIDTLVSQMRYSPLAPRAPPLS